MISKIIVFQKKAYSITEQHIILIRINKTRSKPDFTVVGSLISINLSIYIIRFYTLHLYLFVSSVYTRDILSKTVIIGQVGSVNITEFIYCIVLLIEYELCSFDMIVACYEHGIIHITLSLDQ